MSVRVLLVDDHLLFREGLRALLAARTDLMVCGEASDAEEAYRAFDEHKPDVVAMDVTLPTVSGIDATRELLRRHEGAKVLLLTMHAEPDFVVAGLQAGATGYALKQQPSAQIFEAMLDVARGRSYLCSRISRVVVEDHLRLRRGEHPFSGPCDALSPRERQVFDLLVRGFHNDDIARQLFISVKTVETHRAHVLKKLGLHSVVDLVRFAARHNLLTQ